MLHKKVEFVFLTLYFINTSNGLFFFATNNDNLPPLSRGILNQNQFNLTSFDSSNGFPNQIQMKINIFNSSFSITLGQVEGLIHNSSIYTQVNFRSNPNINGQNLKFKYYANSDNTAFGILMENTDLSSFELNTNGSKFRLILTTYVNKTQVDFVNAIVYNSLTGVQSYQYAYFIRNNIFVDDLVDEFTNLTPYDPCSSNPCFNDGTCSTGYGNSYICFCPISFTGSRCETFFTTTTPFCTICRKQATALANANEGAVQAQLKAANSQQLAYQASSLAKLSAEQTASLALSEIQKIIRLNSSIQSAFLNVINQMTTQTKAISLFRSVSALQMFVSNATFFLNQASSFFQKASSSAYNQVFLQLSLLNDMLSLANSTNKPVSKFQSSKDIANGTQQAISFSQSQISNELAALDAINIALLFLTDKETQIGLLNDILTHIGSFVFSLNPLILEMIDIESTAKDLPNALNLALSLANAAKKAAIQANEAQAVALQAAITAARLALCYPNPCLHGGMCAASPDNVSFTCFCASLFKGTTCQYFKSTSVFSAGKGFSNYENLIRGDEIEKIKERKRRVVVSPSNNQVQSLFVEYLVVIDNSVYNLFQSEFGSNLDSKLLISYIKIFFCQMVYAEPTATPWTNITKVGVPGWYSHENNTSNLIAVDAIRSVNAFADALNYLNLSFSFDYAVAVMNYDIWMSDESQDSTKRNIEDLF